MNNTTRLEVWDKLKANCIVLSWKRPWISHTTLLRNPHSVAMTSTVFDILKSYLAINLHKIEKIQKTHCHFRSSCGVSLNLFLFFKKSEGASDHLWKEYKDSVYWQYIKSWQHPMLMITQTVKQSNNFPKDNKQANIEGRLRRTTI